MARPAWVQVGRILRAHGLRGELRVLNDSDNPERFVPGSLLYARPVSVDPDQAERRELTVRSARSAAGTLIVSFQGIDNRTLAETLRGWVLEVPGSALPELGEEEFYPFDLEGLEVRDLDGRALGVVYELLDTPAQPVLVIKSPDGRLLYAPFTRQAVPTVDRRLGLVVVDVRFVVD